MHFDAQAQPVAKMKSWNYSDIKLIPEKGSSVEKGPEKLYSLSFQSIKETLYPVWSTINKQRNVYCKGLEVKSINHLYFKLWRQDLKT